VRLLGDYVSPVTWTHRRPQRHHAIYVGVPSMLEDIAVAITTGAAGNMVAYMFTGQLDALRAQASRIFRHGSKQEQSVALGKLEEDLAALTQQRANKADLTEQWSDLLFSIFLPHGTPRISW
jgi:hypothetical protein